MTPRARRRPRYADVTASLALILALGGTSYAVTSLPRNSVGTKQLKADAVTSSKVRDGSLSARDFAKGQLPSGATGATGPKGDPGAKGADGSQGPAGLAPAYTNFVPQGTLTGTGPQQLLIVHLPATGAATPGPYLVYANVQFQRADSNAALQDDVVCDLQDSGIGIHGPLDEAEIVLPPNPAKATISLMSTVELSPSAFLFPPVSLVCRRVGNGVGNVTFFDGDIGALEVSSIS